MRHNLVECRISGFTEIGTTQDYGTGVVRINHALGRIVGTGGELPSRGTLWCIRTPAGRRRYALLRNINAGEGPSIWMEYEDRRILGLTKAKPVQLEITKAPRIAYLVFLWEHCDPLVQVQFRVAVLLTCASLIAGAVFGKILS
ncbi:hypothetical protein ACS3SW_00915 [Roseobacteraceae bacterium S113]